MNISETLRNLGGVMPFLTPKEKPSSLFRMVDLFSMTPRDKQELKKQVAQSKGAINILVHPYYHENNPKSSWPITQEYRQTVKDLADSCLQFGKPLIIFEEKRNYEQLRNRFAQQKKGTLFIVKTEPASPEPAVKGSFEKKFILLSNRLKKARVDHVVVGGRYMIFQEIEKFPEKEQESLRQHIALAHIKKHAEEWLDKGLVPIGCPSGVIYMLLPYFEVSISPASSPTNSPVSTPAEPDILSIVEALEDSLKNPKPGKWK